MTQNFRMEKPPSKEKFYEVINNTIQFDHLILFVIRNKNNYKVSKKTGSKTKLLIINRILDFYGIKKPKWFDDDFLDLYKIRNQFAHNIKPQQYSNTKHMDKPSWEKLYKRHTELYNNLSHWICVELMGSWYLRRM